MSKGHAPRPLSVPRDQFDARYDAIFKRSETMREFEIWIEGYIALGGAGEARLLGRASARDFHDAVASFQRANPEVLTKAEAQELKCWGCRLFDNEADARKFAG